MRLFVAIELLPHVRHALKSVQDSLYDSLKPVFPKWVAMDSFHLTLKFLGEAAPALLPQIERQCRETAISFQPFVLSLDQLGCFPSWRHPRVVWVGVDPRRQLLDLANALGIALADHLEVEEKKFQPHVTIARLRSAAAINPVVKQIPAVHQEVKSITLYESQLKRTGARYLVRGQYHLGTV